MYVRNPKTGKLEINKSLRNEIARISPDIELVQEVERGGKTVTVGIPMTVNFFWPSTTT